MFERLSLAELHRYLHKAVLLLNYQDMWLQGRDLNPRRLGYEPNKLPDCSTLRYILKDKRCTFVHATVLKIKAYSITEKMSLNIWELPICFSPFCLPHGGMVPPTFTNRSEI